MKKPRDQLMRTNKNSGSRNRQKGHDLERQIARDLRELGYLKTKTARAASRLLDDCGVDIVYGPPYLIQAKSGYKRSRPKFEVIYSKTKELLKENLPDNAIELQLPIVLVHKLDGKVPENFTVTMQYSDWLQLLNIEKDLFDYLNNPTESVLKMLKQKYGFK